MRRKEVHRCEGLGLTTVEELEEIRPGVPEPAEINLSEKDVLLRKASRRHSAQNPIVTGNRALHLDGGEGGEVSSCYIEGHDELRDLKLSLNLVTRRAGFF